MALILLLSALALGAAFVWWLWLPLYRFEAAALAVVVGLVGWTWIAFLAALVAPFVVAIPLTLVVSAGVTIALWYPHRATRPQWRPLEGGRPAWIVWGAATAVTTVTAVVLFWTHSLLADDTGVYSASSTWADFGLHAAIVSHVAEFDRLPLDMPVASGTSMTYPFLVDFLSGLYLKTGSGIHLSLFVPGVLLALAICQLLISFGLRLFGRVGVAVGGLGLLLLTGSAVGLPVAYTEWRESDVSLPVFLSALPRDYTTLSEFNGNVTNIVSHALLPQRAFLFGLGVALAVFVLLHAARESDDRRLLFTGAALIGLLPMAHPHSFLATGSVLLALSVEAAIRARRVPWAHLAAGGLALAMAAPQLAWQQLANGDGTGGRIRFGWEVGEGEPILDYWFANFGLMGIFFVVLPFLLLRAEWRKYLVWYLPFAGLLVVTQVYAFQPFEYDNLKLIYYVYLMAGLFAAFLAGEAIRARRWAVAVVVPLAVVVAVPGFLSITRELQQRDQFASIADVALAGWVRDNTAPDDVFLTTDRPNQPIATLGGRSIVMGYRGWLYNFNVPYSDREAAVRAGLEGRVDDPVVLAFDPEYLAVATNEDPSYTIDRDALSALPVAFTNEEWTIYQLPDRAGAPGSPVSQGAG